MKGISARRIKVKLGEVWESPNLHILFTKEDEVIVARCLDFTISSHGENEKEALESLGSALKEYIMTAVDDKQRISFMIPPKINTGECSMIWKPELILLI